MNTKYNFIFTPQLGVNDQTARITEWFFQDGDHVENSTIICSIETTKATYDIENEYDGLLKIIKPSGSDVLINQPLAAIFCDAENYKAYADLVFQEHNKKTNDNKRKDKIITAKAEKKAKELNVDLSEIKKKGTVKEKDVLAYYNEQKETKSFVDISKLKLDSEKNNVFIYGAGKGGETVYETLSQRSNLHFVGFVDDSITEKRKSKHTIIHSSQLEEIAKLNNIYFIIAISNAHIREEKTKAIQALNIPLINIIHPGSVISDSAEMGKGNHIKSGAVIETATQIGNCCIIDNGTIIPHDNKIGDYCHLAPGVSMGSDISIEEYSIVGIGASISTGVTIGKNCIIGVGSSVNKNIPDNSIVEGVPGKIIGKRQLKYI